MEERDRKRQEEECMGGRKQGRRGGKRDMEKEGKWKGERKKGSKEEERITFSTVYIRGCKGREKPGLSISYLSFLVSEQMVAIMYPFFMAANE